MLPAELRVAVERVDEPTALVDSVAVPVERVAVPVERLAVVGVPVERLAVAVVPVERLDVATLPVERLDAVVPAVERLAVAVEPVERLELAALVVREEVPALLRVVLPNVLRADAIAPRCEVPVRWSNPLAALRSVPAILRLLTVLVLRISRALVMPALRRAKERSGLATAYSLRDTPRCKS